MMNGKTLFCNVAFLILNFIYEGRKTFLVPLFTSINGFGRRVTLLTDVLSSGLQFGE